MRLFGFLPVVVLASCAHVEPAPPAPPTMPPSMIVQMVHAECSDKKTCLLVIQYVMQDIAWTEKLAIKQEDWRQPLLYGCVVDDSLRPRSFRQTTRPCVPPGPPMTPPVVNNPANFKKAPLPPPPAPVNPFKKK